MASIIRTRKATIDDLDYTTNLAKKIYGAFFETIGIPLDDNSIREVAYKFIRHGANVIIERDSQIVGMAGWTISQHPFNKNIKVFSEALWCMDSDHPSDALRLLRAFEAEAKLAKADIVCMANLNNGNEKKLTDIYERLGYQFIESHYIKSIGGR